MEKGLKTERPGLIGMRAVHQTWMEPAPPFTMVELLNIFPASSKVEGATPMFTPEAARPDQRAAPRDPVVAVVEWEAAWAAWVAAWAAWAG